MNPNCRRRRQTTYPALLNVRCPADVHELIYAEAGRQRCTPAELARRLVLAGIAAERLALPEPPHP